MATKTRALKMPNGTEYEFFGATWYGECSTSGTTQAKTVSINGFTSSVLVAGVRVVVKFANYQGYDGIPTLNVSGTGAKNIARNSRSYPDYAQQDEWPPGGVIGFIYDGTNWVIENGEHGGNYYGAVKTTPLYKGVDNQVALTSQSIFSYDYDMRSYYWRSGYQDGDSIIVLDSATPSADQWEYDGGVYKYTFSNINWDGQAFSQKYIPKIVAISFNGNRYYANMSLLYDYAYFSYILPMGDHDVYLDISVDTSPVCTIIAPTAPGAYPIKIECYIGTDAGVVAYPMLKDELSQYLTLADLPIYDGSSSPVTQSSS